MGTADGGTIHLDMGSSELPSAAALFELIWSRLATVLGAPATATLLRRAVRGAAANRPDLDLAHITIVREDLEYHYALPERWHTAADEPRAALELVVRDQLLPLLGELAGPLGARLLDPVAELRRSGLLEAGAEAS